MLKMLLLFYYYHPCYYCTFHFYLLQALFYYLFRFNTYFPANIPAPTTFLLQECNENIFTDIIAVPGTINALPVVILQCVL